MAGGHECAATTGTARGKAARYNHDLWTATTSGGTATASATWTAALSANACYNVSAWIPANYHADNADAVYDITIWNGSAGAGGPFTLNMAPIGNIWAGLGQIQTQSGLVTVNLGNTGSSGSYPAADDLRFQPC